MVESYIIGVDLGANSGRAVVGNLTSEKLEVEELRRFSNDPILINGRLYWDVLKIFAEIKQSLKKCSSKYEQEPLSIGIDSWGVDYGLFDKKGRLLRNPVHYRDSRTRGLISEALKVMSRKRIFETTGIQFLELNTLYQLFAQKREFDHLLESSESLLMMADVLNYFLTGKMVTEFSLATTTQLYDTVKKQWATDIFKEFGFPLELMQDVVSPGTKIGTLANEVSEEVGLSEVSVIVPATHDTASAVAAIPAHEDNWAFISSGTWSLLGTELETPFINEEAMKANFTNEGGVGGKYRFLRNLTGLWIVQE